MRLAILLAAAVLVTALPAVAADPISDFVEENTPSCHASVSEDGTTGAGCRLAQNCFSVVWGYHSEFLTVGGGSSCSGGVWLNPDEGPELPPVDVCRGLFSFC